MSRSRRASYPHVEHRLAWPGLLLFTTPLLFTCADEAGGEGNPYEASAMDYKLD